MLWDKTEELIEKLIVISAHMEDKKIKSQLKLLRDQKYERSLTGEGEDGKVLAVHVWLLKFKTWHPYKSANHGSEFHTPNTHVLT